MFLSVIFAILGFSFVIIIHELGHFLFAKWAGVKVLRFALGFPPIVWEKKVGETSYAIGLIWAGGYVHLLGEEDADARADPRSMLNARPGWRALILFGGVLFNLVSSWLMLLALAWYGMPITPPVVAGIHPTMVDPANSEQSLTSPAVKLGLKLGDEIRAVNGVRTRSFEDVMNAVGLSGGKSVVVVARRDGQDLTLGEGQDIRPVKSRGLPMLGIESPTGFRIQEIVDAVGESPEALQGRGWMLDSVDGKPVAGRQGQDVERELESRVGQDITFVFRRGAESHQATLLFAGTNLPLFLAVGFPVRVTGPPMAGTPAALAGLKAGDVVVAVDDRKVSGIAHFSALVQAAAISGRAMILDIRRGNVSESITLTAQPSADGRLRLGLPIADLTRGWLPVIPETITGKSGGLAAAGLKPGDALLDLQLDKLDKKTRRVPALIARGGQPVVLGLSDTLPSKDLKSLRAVISGKRVLAVDATALRLADTAGKDGAPIAITDLPKEAAATLAGLQVGDWIVRVDASGDGKALEIVRGAGLAESVEIPVGDGGFAFSLQDEVRPYHLEYPSEPIAIANHMAWQMVVNTLTIIPKLFKSASAEDSLEATKTLSGPVTIFSIMMGQFERDGFAAWLRIVAVIGLNLFLVNLLPIPMVDGGQLVQLGIEVAMGRPLPDRLKMVIDRIGFAMVVSLMLFALSIDIMRKAGML